MIKALVVDDEERMLNALEKNIHWKDCGVDYLFKAETMDEALQCYMVFKPDIIITDIEMPDGSGLELMEKLREMEASVACLCVTCHPEFSYMRKAMQLGSVDYILKPVEYEEMESVLKKIVYNINSGKMDKLQSNLEQSVFSQSALYEDEKSVLEAQNYIRQHLSNDLNVQIIASYLHCSTSHLMHIFKQKTGKTVIEYITNERIEKGKQLLKGADLQINVVAKLCGYDDYSYFTRVFKKETGFTPREYRNRLNKI